MSFSCNEAILSSALYCVYFEYSGLAAQGCFRDIWSLVLHNIPTGRSKKSYLLLDGLINID